MRWGIGGRQQGPASFIGNRGVRSAILQSFGSGLWITLRRVQVDRGEASRGPGQTLDREVAHAA